MSLLLAGDIRLADCIHDQRDCLFARAGQHFKFSEEPRQSPIITTNGLFIGSREAGLHGRKPFITRNSTGEQIERTKLAKPTPQHSSAISQQSHTVNGHNDGDTINYAPIPICRLSQSLATTPSAAHQVIERTICIVEG